LARVHRHLSWLTDSHSIPIIGLCFGLLLCRIGLSELQQISQGLRTSRHLTLIVCSKKLTQTSTLDMPPRRRPFFVMLGIAAAMLLIMAVFDLIRPVPPETRLRLFRDELAGLRAASDSCRSALEGEEADLAASDAWLDSLKNLIGFYEGLDPRGVPVDSYDVYLEIFNAYNRGVPGRAAAGDTLQTHWQACRDLTERHNTIADSARVIAEELGLLEDNSQRERVP
jgi:hypothetical protein